MAKPPFAWFGGKQNLAPTILQRIPPHHIYVEPFGGSAAVLMAKDPSPVEVYNDLDEGLVNFFRVLRDPQKADRLQVLLQLTPYSRQGYGEALSSWVTEPDPVEKARLWFTVAASSFSGDFGHSWRRAFADRNHTSTATYKFMNGIDERLPGCIDRLRHVQIENLPWEKCLEAYDSPQTFFYLDPPYPHDTRKKGGYRHEMTDDDHRRLIEAVIHLQGAVVMSTYENPIYRQLQTAGWHKEVFEVTASSAGRTRRNGRIGLGATTRFQDHRTEILWIKPTGKGQLRWSVKN